MSQKDYRVVWEIDIHADTPEEAAREVVDCLRTEPPSKWCHKVIDKETKREVLLMGEEVSNPWHGKTSKTPILPDKGHEPSFTGKEQ